jgi:hypothetical protein
VTTATPSGGQAVLCGKDHDGHGDGLHRRRKTGARAARARLVHRREARRGEAIEDDELRTIVEAVEHKQASAAQRSKDPFRVVKRQFGYI